MDWLDMGDLPAALVGASLDTDHCDRSNRGRKPKKIAWRGSLQGIAARAAGNALHDNPIPIVVPCHRVVPSGGGVGKYGGHEWRKEFLLRLEGALHGSN